MARLARLVIPGIPHHVTQRGNGRARTFFSDADYSAYRDDLARSCAAAAVRVWSWVLMPNHVHLILVPEDEDGLRRVLAPVHRRHAGRVHRRLKRTGHFWQGRFGCVAIDEAHLAAAIRYIALNPVRARLVARAADWRWASTRALLGLEADGLTEAPAVHARFDDFAALIAVGDEDEAIRRLRRAETIGRPLGDAAFIARLEARTGRALAPVRPGPKAKAKEHAEVASRNRGSQN